MLYAFEDFELDPRRFELRRSGHLRPMRRKPLDLLLYPVEHRDRVVLKTELHEHLWPGVRVTNNALVQAVAAVRDSLAGAESGGVVSIRSRGYRFVLPVIERALCDGVTERSE